MNSARTVESPQMRSRKFARLCKFFAYLCVAITVYYLITNCREFDPDLKGKLSDINHMQAKIGNFLSKWNVMMQSNEEKGAERASENHQNDVEIKDEDTQARNEVQNGSLIRSSLNTFVSLLEEHQKVEAGQRNAQFDKFMTMLTRVLHRLEQQRENNHVGPEIVPSQNPTTLPKTTTFLHDTKYTSFERKTTASSETFPPISSTSSNKQLQAILERQAKLFLDKMKMAGIQYTSNNFYYNPKRSEAGIFYREVVPPVTKVPDTTVFLLHGEKYNSKLWLSIGTLYVLGTNGFRVIAVDLPGHGRSKNTSELPTSVERSRLLAAMMLKLSPKGRRVLVSPGKSGIYSVPLVMTLPSTLDGVVFIAPNFTSKYPSSSYAKISLAALVIFGTNDETMLHESSLDDLEHLANKKIYSLANARHDCYIDQPDAFHRLLTRFLEYYNKQ